MSRSKKEILDILILANNDEKFLHQSIYSMITQKTPVPLRILVGVYGKQQDNTVEVAETMLRRYRKFNLLIDEEMDRKDIKNALLEKAARKGYLMITEGCSYLHQDSITRYLNKEFIDNDTLGFSYGGYNIIIVESSDIKFQPHGYPAYPFHRDAMLDIPQLIPLTSVIKWNKLDKGFIFPPISATDEKLIGQEILDQEYGLYKTLMNKGLNGQYIEKIAQYTLYLKGNIIFPKFQLQYKPGIPRLNKQGQEQLAQEGVEQSREGNTQTGTDGIKFIC